MERFRTPEQVGLFDDLTRGRLSRRGFLTRAAAVGISATTASALLAACDSSTGPTAPGGNAEGYQAGSAPLKVQLGPEITGPRYPDPWNGPRARTIEKFGDQTTEFTVLTRQQTATDMETNKFSQWLEEQTGVKIRYDVIPMGDDGAPKLNAIIASGELPDLFMLGPAWMGGFSRSQLYVYGQQGLFTPLDQLVDEYAPELRGMFDYTPALRSYLTTPDQTLYGFPAVNDCYHCKSAGTRAFVNTRWLETLGMSKPTTTDELRTMLMAFKTRNPSGVAGSIPFSVSVDHWAVGYFLQSFVQTGPKPSLAGKGTSWLRRTGDELVFTPIEPGFRDGLRFIAGLVRDGLFDPNSFSQTADQLKRRGMNEAGSLVGMTMGNTSGSLVDNEPSNPRNRALDYDFLPPVAGPGGRAWVPWNYAPGADPNIAISKTCKDPQTMIRWADAQLGLVATLFGNYGVPEQGWSWAGASDTGIDQRQSVYTIGTDDQPDNVAWSQWNSYGLTLDVRNGQTADQSGYNAEAQIYAAGKASEPFAVPEAETFAEPYYDTDQSAQISELTTNLESHYDQSIAQFCTGALNIDDDAAWNAYRDRFAQLGLDNYLALNVAAMKAGR